MDGPSRPDVLRPFDEGTAIDRAFRRAAREAVRRHKQTGVALAYLIDGEVVLVDPEDVELPADEDAAPVLRPGASERWRVFDAGADPAE